VAAPSVTLYNLAATRSADATNLLVPSGSFKITLHDSSYTFSAAHSVYADLTNELSTGFGYTNGGLALSNVVLTNVTTNDWMFDFDDPQWTASGGSIPAWRYAVVRRVGTVNGFVDPLIACILGDSAPADVGATASTYILKINLAAAGFITGTVA
jgi:hypothetical protein